MSNIEDRFQRWMPENQMKAAIIALKISGYTVDRIVATVGMTKGYVEFILSGKM